MSDRTKEILEGLNKIWEFLGHHGGEIVIEEDWDFYCKVSNYNGFYEIEIFSYGGVNHYNLVDPFFKIEVTLNEDHSKIIEAKPVEYISQFGLGEIDWSIYNNACVYDGECETMEEDIEQRLCSYLRTITEIRPYLTSPQKVDHYTKNANDTD